MVVPLDRELTGKSSAKSASTVSTGSYGNSKRGKVDLPMSAVTREPILWMLATGLLSSCTSPRVEPTASQRAPETPQGTPEVPKRAQRTWPELPTITVNRTALAARGVGYRDDLDNIYVVLKTASNSFDVYFGDTARLVLQTGMGTAVRANNLDVAVSVDLRAPRSSLTVATLDLEAPPPAPLTLLCEGDVKVRLVPLAADETKHIVASATFHSPQVPLGVVFFGQMGNGVFLLIEHAAPSPTRRAFLGPKGKMRPVTFVREHQELVQLGGQDAGKSIVETSAGQYSSLGSERTWTPIDGAAMPLERMSGPDLLRLRFAEPAVYGRMGYVCDDL